MTVTVYCSSAENLPAEYYDMARRVAREIALGGHTLIFGGIRRGMMRVVAEEAQKAGGKVVGVIPATRRDLADSTNARLNDHNIFTADVNERKAQMISRADAFVVLPGGYGTLDELLSTITVLTFENAGKDTPFKPITLYNPDHLYDPLFDMLESMRSRGLINASLPPIEIVDF